MPRLLSLRHALSILLPIALVPAHAGAAIFTVGSDADCTHGTIQSALDAADASPGADTVRLTRSLTYEPEADSITTDQNLNVVGGFETCSSPASDGFKTVVSGAGGAQEPVFRITANGAAIIKIRLLTITLGDEDGAGFGGGIYFRGTGNLEIIESDITNNTAGYGGGIFAEALGTNAELIISNNNTISGNTARYSGGGLYIGGPLEMTMIAPSSIIAFNEALGLDDTGGYGGGIQVTGPAIAYIGSSGIGGLGAIYSNSARDGGGISITSGSDDGLDALVHLFTTDPLNPIMVRGNDASDRGGGVYLQGYEDFFSNSTAHLCAWDFRIEDNFARDGSAIYENFYTSIGYIGGDVHLNDPACVHPGAVRCASGVPCNTISGNDADMSGAATDGATIRLLDGAELNANRFEMRGNRGGYAFRASSDSYVTIGISTCLLAENEVTRRLISTEGIPYLTLEDCTLARNLIGSTDVLHAQAGLVLSRSIIDQPGNLTLAYSGPADELHVSYVLSSDITSLPSDPSIVAGAPLFVDNANGDYHQRLASPGIDFAPPVVGDDRDLDGQPRDQNMAGVPDLFGVRDLGAYERQRGLLDCGGGDTIFCDGFDLL